MGIRRLTRKAKRDKLKSQTRISSIKHFSSTPVIKKVDVEAIKAAFEKKKTASKDSHKDSKKEVPVSRSAAAPTTAHTKAKADKPSS